MEGAHFDAWSPNQWKAKCRSKGTLIFYGGILVSAYTQNCIMEMWKKSSKLVFSDNIWGASLSLILMSSSNQSGFSSNKDLRQRCSFKCIWTKLIDLGPVSTWSNPFQNRTSRGIYHITEACWGRLFCHLCCDSLHVAGSSAACGMTGIIQYWFCLFPFRNGI